MIHHSPQKKQGLNYYYASFLAYLLKFTKTPIITVSNASKYALENSTTLNNLNVIYNGISAKKLKKESLNLRKIYSINKKHLIIGSIGPIEPHKGHKVILEAFKNSTLLKENCTFLIVGSGKKEIIKSLEDKIKSYNLIKNIIFAGFLKNDSFSIIKGFDVFVMPTLDFEGFGYSMAEAMISKKFVIASNVERFLRLSTTQKWFLVNPNDISKWTKLLEYAILDPLGKKFQLMQVKRLLKIFLPIK